MLLKKEDFYNSYFKKNKTFEYYKYIRYQHNKEVFFKNTSELLKANKAIAYTITLFPNYFYSEIADKTFTVKKAVQKNLDGFAILTNGYKDIDAYLQNHLKSKTRGPILKRIKRLENCFNIEYKMYYGDISKTLYDTALSRLKELLINRYAQKNDTTEAFAKWSHYEQTTFEAIKNKSASLFLVYENNTIIGVSINYHVKNVFIGHLFCYDISYSKFSLGNTMVYSLLEWCFKNKYSVLDMGNGNLEYKQIWCNLVYNYEYHFIFKKKSVLAYLLAHFEIIKIDIKNTLKSFKIDKLYNKIKKKTFGHTVNNIKSFLNYKTETINLNNLDITETEKIDYNGNEYQHVKKPIMDFLYTELEHIDNLEVFAANKTTYILKGTKKAQKIIFDL